jgi:hypothetical protein
MKENVLSLKYNPLDCYDNRSAWVCDNLSDDERRRIQDEDCEGPRDRYRLTDCEKSMIMDYR